VKKTKIADLLEYREFYTLLKAITEKVPITLERSDFEKPIAELNKELREALE